MKSFFVILLFPVFCFCLDRFEILKDFVNIETSSQIRGVDGLFLINLDKRPEKLEAAKKEFDNWGLSFCRFSAVEGYLLSSEEASAAGLIYDHTMKPMRAKLNLFIKQTEPLSQKHEGKACFYKGMSPGALGCYLSHLSIIKKAYDLGLNRVWIFEDDVVFLKNPKEVEEKIEELNTLVGLEGWDILFTDDVSILTTAYGAMFYRPDNNSIFKEVKKGISLDCRKKNYSKKTLTPEDVQIIYNRKILGLTNHYNPHFNFPDIFGSFRRISGRYFTHSMILNRSGMQKILDFYEKRGVFLPYDDELGSIPFIKIFNIKEGITSMTQTISDTIW